MHVLSWSGMHASFGRTVYLLVVVVQTQERAKHSKTEQPGHCAERACLKPGAGCVSQKGWLVLRHCQDTL